MGIFGKKQNKKSNTQNTNSMGDERVIDKIITPKVTAEELKITVQRTLNNIETQKILFRGRFESELRLAKNAQIKGDKTSLARHGERLKFFFAVNKYFTSMENAFLLLQSRMDIQEISAQFADVVNDISKVSIPAAKTDFNKITNDIIKKFATIDMSGINDMENQLIKGALTATDASREDEQFIQKLLDGSITLDDPYESPTLKEVKSKSEQEVLDNIHSSGDEDGEALLRRLMQMDA